MRLAGGVYVALMSPTDAATPDAVGWGRGNMVAVILHTVKWGRGDIVAVIPHTVGWGRGDIVVVIPHTVGWGRGDMVAVIPHTVGWGRGDIVAVIPHTVGWGRGNFSNRHLQLESVGDGAQDLVFYSHLLSLFRTMPSLPRRGVNHTKPTIEECP